MAVREKILQQESIRLLTLLNENGVEALPYKGFYFTQILNSGLAYRESSDIDIVIRDLDKAMNGIEILKSQGYRILGEVQGLDFIDLTWGRQITLEKGNVNGLTIHVDFHWGVNEKYHEYKISTEDFFEDTCWLQNKYVNIRVPGDKALFKMLINHHGARGCWLKLKELFDWTLFLRKTNLSLEECRQISKSMKMEKIMSVGEKLASHTLLQKCDNSSSKVEIQIINYWSDVFEIFSNKFIRFLKFTQIYIHLQDKDASKIRLAWNYIRFKGSYFPQYNYYYRPFKGRLLLLNFIFKYVSIFYQFIIGKFSFKQ